jgi:hypothetical protein
VESSCECGNGPSGSIKCCRLTVSESACLGVEPTLGLVTRSEGCCLKVAVLFLSGAYSDERTGLRPGKLYGMAVQLVAS